MQFSDYQSKTARTAGVFSSREIELATWALGVAGEAGEVAEHVKKFLGHGHAIDRDALAKEIGDVLWYCAALARALDLSLDAIAETNVAKLMARYPDGFSHDRSVNRLDK